jgi:hypothetical protein
LEEMMNLPSVLVDLRRAPGMFGCMGFDSVASYIEGYDAALSGGLLVGFREWLVVKVDQGNNLSWTALVRLPLEVSGVLGPPDGQRRTDAQEREAVEFLFVTLENYLAVRSERVGLRRVFLEYENWLRRQSWYGPDSVHWIDNESRRRRSGVVKKRRTR